ncbi:unnamed protein product [Danaus chrysippus]|uniref:(African queen) hypothetical protein n=1 Tax=Danaus chrysippus TaxID=151541 RepID=A0A8J2RCA6_9NEOP|nr:unnamed protein product [Danaus chrysippus]
MSRKSRQGYTIRHLLQLPSTRSPGPHPPPPAIKSGWRRIGCHITAPLLLSKFLKGLHARRNDAERRPLSR